MKLRRSDKVSPEHKQKTSPRLVRRASRRQRSSPSVAEEPVSAVPAAAAATSPRLSSPMPQRGSKLSKFFGASIETQQRMAAPLAELQPKTPEEVSRGKLGKFFGEEVEAHQIGGSRVTTPPPVVESLGVVQHTSVCVSRPRRSSSVGSMEQLVRHHSSLGDPTSGPPLPHKTVVKRAASPSAGMTERLILFGRLSVTVWKPDGLSKKTRYVAEVSIENSSQEVERCPSFDRKSPADWSYTLHLNTMLDATLIVRLVDKTRSLNATAATPAAAVNLRDLVMGVETITTLHYNDHISQRISLLPLDFGRISAEMEDDGLQVPLRDPYVLDVIVMGVRDLHLERKQLGGALTCVMMNGKRACRTPKRPGAPTMAWSFDATFPLQRDPHLDLMIIKADSFPGEVLAMCKINISKIKNNTFARRTGLWFRLRSAEHETPSGYVHLKLQLSDPNKTRSMLAGLGKPLRTIPYRLDWGDVVLFDTKTINASIVSAATSSTWDHVAIIYEDADGTLLLLEAVSQGVFSSPAEQRLADALQTTNKIGIRRLQFHRTAAAKQQLTHYAMAMNGKSYKKSVGQLFGSRTRRNRAEDHSSVFCSELVAACYKHLGLLDSQIITSNILPKDFTSDSFPLSKGSFGPLKKFSRKVQRLAEGDVQQSGRSRSSKRAAAIDRSAIRSQALTADELLKVWDPDLAPPTKTVSDFGTSLRVPSDDDEEEAAK